MKTTLTIFLLSALAAFSQSIELRSVTILGGVEIGVVNTNVAEPPVGDGFPNVAATGWTTNRESLGSLNITNLEVASSGSGRLLLVAVTWYNNPARTISSITWNGGAQSLSQICTTNATDAALGSGSVWGLVNPAAATTDVVVTWSGNISEAALAALVITNAHQTVTYGTVATNYVASSGRYFTNVVSGVSNDLCVSAIHLEGVSGSFAITNEAGATQWNFQNNTNRSTVMFSTIPFVGTSHTNIANLDTTKSTPVALFTIPVKQP